MKRLKYEIDPHNRLVVSKMDRSGLPKYRLSLDGYFKTGKQNSLQYIIKTPHKYSAYDKLPYRVNFKGHYTLTKDHNILLTLRRSYKQRSQDALLLKSEIIFVKENTLGLAVKTKNSDGTVKTRLLSLNGKWRMDSKNKILFLVEKGRGKYDTLTFTGTWVVNKDNEIEYSYERSKSRRKERLIFKGLWEIVENNKLRYSLGLKDDTGFEIKASLARTGFLGKKNALLYKLETRLTTKRFKPKSITISGRWKLTKRMGLLFEVRYSNRRRNYLSFGAEVRLNKKDELIFLLKDKKNKPLGIEIILKRRFLGNSGEALLKLLATKKERSITLSVGRLF